MKRGMETIFTHSYSLLNLFVSLKICLGGLGNPLEWFLSVQGIKEIDISHFLFSNTF